MNAGHASAAHPMGGGDDQEIVPESRSPRIAPPDETDDDEGSEAFDSGDDGEYLTSAQRRLRECWRVIERTSEENRWQVFKNTGLLLVPLIRNGRLNSSQVANFFQEIAESTGLVESYGQDAVQQVLKEIAAKASPFCEDERELGGAASDAMERIPEWKRDIFTAEDLQTMAFEPLAFLVKDLIPAEGVTLLCSRPKLGKSWLLYDLCIGCAANRYILGSIKPEQGEVLYLALEDSRRRLQRRMTKLLPTFHGKWPKGLTLKTKWRRLHEGGLDDIRAWYKDVKARGGKPVAVAIDVLAKVRKPVGNRQIYEADYEALTGLTQLA